MFKITSHKLFSLIAIAALFAQTFLMAVHAQKTVERENVKDEIGFENPSIIEGKIAPDLIEKSEELNYGLRADENQRVIIRLKSET